MRSRQTNPYWQTLNLPILFLQTPTNSFWALRMLLHIRLPPLNNYLKNSDFIFIIDGSSPEMGQGNSPTSRSTFSDEALDQVSDLRHDRRSRKANIANGNVKEEQPPTANGNNLEDIYSKVCSVSCLLREI